MWHYFDFFGAPSRLGHVHNLVFKRDRHLDIFFPFDLLIWQVVSLASQVVNWTCHAINFM